MNSSLVNSHWVTCCCHLYFGMLWNMLAKTVKYKKKKKDADLQSKHKFNGRDPEQNYFDNSPKKGLHTTTFYLLFERIYSKLQRSLPFDVPCWSSYAILTVLMRNTAVRSVQDSQSLFYQFLVPDFSNIMIIIIITYFTRVDPLAKLL